MKTFSLKKLPILIILLSLCLFVFCDLAVFASDYQYKVLDTKYNPSAAQLLDNTQKTTTSSSDDSVNQTKQGFDFLRFIALMAALAFPFFVLKYSLKTFVRVFEDLKEKGIDYVPEEDLKVGNESQESEQQTENNELKEDDSETSEQHVVTAEIRPVNDKVKNTNKTKPKRTKATPPIVKKKPIMINKAKLTKNKGLCVVQQDDMYALVGYINEKVFLLKKFNELKSQEIRPRFTEAINNKDRYIVRLGTSYKALVEVGEEDINLLIEL